MRRLRRDDDRRTDTRLAVADRPTWTLATLLAALAALLLAFPGGTATAAHIEIGPMPGACPAGTPDPYSPVKHTFCLRTSEHATVSATPGEVTDGSEVTLTVSLDTPKCAASLSERVYPCAQHVHWDGAGTTEADYRLVRETGTFFIDLDRNVVFGTVGPHPGNYYRPLHSHNLTPTSCIYGAAPITEAGATCTVRFVQNRTIPESWMVFMATIDVALSRIPGSFSEVTEHYIIETAARLSPPTTNIAPTASFSWQASAADPLTIDFDASASTDDEAIASYEWDFGDGESGAGATASHAYDAAGTYPVTLTVTDADGATDTDLQNVTVASCPETPQAVMQRATLAASGTWAATFQIEVRNSAGAGVRNVRVGARDNCGGELVVSDPTDRSGRSTLALEVEGPATVTLTPLLEGHFAPAEIQSTFAAGPGTATRTVQFQTADECFFRPVTVLGTESADSLSLFSNDVVDALGSGDVIEAEPGQSRFVACGGDGPDRMFLTTDALGEDRLDGGAGSDTINGGFGCDEIFGGIGNDRIDGGADPDSPAACSLGRLDGGADDDVIDGGIGPFTDRLLGGPGCDGLRGGGGDDQLDGGLDSDAPSPTCPQGGLSGGDHNDTVAGGGGDDAIAGDAGSDRLLGGTDDDALDGGPGCDGALGEAGNDSLTGGDGNDGPATLSGCAGGGLDGGMGEDTVSGGVGRDLLLGREGCDGLKGGDGNDTLDGGGDGDLLAELDSAGCEDGGLFGDAGVDTVFGGSGSDHISGGDNDDILWGDGSHDGSPVPSAPDVVFGMFGNDRIRGGTEPSEDCGSGDELHGGPGVDTIDGEGGGDVIFGGPGGDIVHGGIGCDDVSGNEGADEIHGGDNPAATIEILYGDEGKDEIYGDGGRDAIRGGDDKDEIDGGGGDDILDGGVTGFSNPPTPPGNPDGLVPADEPSFGGLGNDVDTVNGGDGSDRCAARGDTLGDDCELKKTIGPNRVWPELLRT
jgi:Ca2+-binding RTX toxin-like protein